MYVLKTKEKVLALKNIHQKECALRYKASVWLKINPKETNSIVRKGHKMKSE